MIWENKLYYGNSSNQPTSISVDLSAYATKDSPTFTGTIHLNSANIRLGAASSSSNVKIKIGDGDYIYLHEDQDDHLTIYSKKGIDFTSLNNSGTFTVNGNAIGSSSSSGSGDVNCKIISGYKTLGSNGGVEVVTDFRGSMVICGIYSTAVPVVIVTPWMGWAIVNGTSKTSSSTMTTTGGFKIDSSLTSAAANKSMYFVLFSWENGTW